MKILTFDTSLNKTYVTFGEDEKIIIAKALSSDEEKYHSTYLVPELLNLLKQEKITFGDIDVIGINEGPGSFTGIRICTVIARTAAQQLGIKVIPVPSLEILARINKTDKDALVLLDARKNKVYAAVYDKNGAEKSAPHALNIDELDELIKLNDFEIITDSSIHKLLEGKNISSTNYEADNYELGKYLYNIVCEKSKTDNDYHWAKAKPLYIQPPSITMPKKVVQ
ncbi:MAG: tRNA (adenosine(37)-N6)-threonylcarbamoyltransferase complex dimerization subunit type 1 TsaB [Candidatus Gastranaerophilaceae bacterium]